jgi:type IV pilus assembly protein PilW
MQENGRFALEVLSRDIRMAGYNGCGRNVSTANVLNPSSDQTLIQMLDFSTPIHGYNDGDIPPFLTGAGALSSSDALILIGGDGGDLVVKSHNPPSAQIDTNAHSIKPGEILLITDCSKASIFQMTDPTNNNNNATNLVHNTGKESPGNCTKFLGTSCPGSSSYTYKPGSILMRLSSSAYFIGNSSLNDGSHSLYVLELDGTRVTQTARELLTGVHDMQITYGIDSDGDFDVNSFNTANNITNWSQVIAVRVSLTMRSSKTNISTERTALTKDFTETVVARNRTM